MPAYSRNAVPFVVAFRPAHRRGVASKENVPESRSEKFMVHLNEDSFKGYKFEVPKLEWETSKDELVSHLYEEMVKMRRMEMAADQLYNRSSSVVSATWPLVRRPSPSVWRPA